MLFIGAFSKKIMILVHLRDTLEKSQGQFVKKKNAKKNMCDLGLNV